MNRKEYMKEYNRKYRILNRDKIKKINNEYYRKNAEKLNKKNSQWKKDNKEIVNRMSRKYKREHKHMHANYHRKRYKNDIIFRILSVLRARLGNAIRAQGSIKSNRTIDLIGCTIDELKKYMEKLWQKDMSWDNYGKYGWHIDHIKPCDSFDLSDPKQQRECFHYSNLQPLWAKDNLNKGSKY